MAVPRRPAASALVNHYIALVEAQTGIQPQVLTFIAAEGGQEYDNLNEGSDSFNDLLNGLRDAQAYAASIGKVAICPAIFTNHGQNGPDKGASTMRYVAALRQFRRLISAACRSIFGQAEDPQIIMTQTDAGLNRAPGNANFYTWSPAQAQAILARGLGFTVALNEGYLPLAPDGLHCSNEGYYRQGMAWARSALGEINGIGHSGMFVYAVHPRSPTVFDFEIHVPGDADLLIRPDGIVPDFAAGTQSLYGMQFATASGLITAAAHAQEVIDPATIAAEGESPNARWLRTTFDDAPAGVLRWTAAMRKDANGLGRSQIGTTLAHAPLQTLPSGFDDTDYLAASFGDIPALA